MKIHLLIMSLFLSTACFSQLNLVPMPAQITMGNGTISLRDINSIQYVSDGELDTAVSQLANRIEELTGHAVLVKNLATRAAVTETALAAKTNCIILFSHPDTAFINDEAYEIKVTKNAPGSKISITGGTEKSLFYGIQTLLQLLPGTKASAKNNPVIPQLTIKDQPRFAYRGMHLDVTRHFYPVAAVKKYIDHLAAYKYNTFHWHLTDDQGWRIEIKKYPLLTQAGGYRNGTIIGRYPGKGNDSLHYGGYYTQDQVREVIQYAAARFITVIPEIEMPGHASAAIAAYPQLSCFPAESTATGNTPWAGTRLGKQVQQTWGVFEDVYCPSEYTFNFLQDVLDEVMALFPATYIHIGGDECPKDTWKRSEFCQRLIKENNLKDEHGLQSYFIQRIERYINSKGKKIIGWDEILEGGLAPNATVMSWRGEEGGIQAAQQGHDVIMTPGAYCYFDHSQSLNEDSVTIGGYLPLEKVYSYEPVPAALSSEQAKHILGAQANVWTEYIGNERKLEYTIFPRILALSEVLWSPAAKRNYADFERRLPVLLDQLDKQGINYSKAYYDLKATVLPAPDNDGITWQVETKNMNGHQVKIEYPADIDTLVHIFDSVGNEVKDRSAIPYKETLVSHGNKNTTSVHIKKSGLATAWLLKGDNSFGFEMVYDDKHPVSTITQAFHFNKATGKSITLANSPSVNYPGDGAFTLVNGIQNEKGLGRSNEFLGFLGKDLDASIDLGKLTDISKVTIHVFDQQASWIYLPAAVEITYQPDVDVSPGMQFPTAIKTIDPIKEQGTRTITVEAKYPCRFLHIVVKNFGTIPPGNPGAGTPAWLFVDEIEVE